MESLQLSLQEQLNNSVIKNENMKIDETVSTEDTVIKTDLENGYDDELQEKRNCTGFEENIVLAVKECFFEDEIRSILIKKTKNGKKVKYYSRSCSNSAAVNKKVCVFCDKWFTCLSAGLPFADNSLVRPHKLKHDYKPKIEDEEDDWAPGKPLDNHESDVELGEGEVKKSLKRRGGVKGSGSCSINKGVADQYKVEGGWICKVPGCGMILSLRRAWIKHVRSHSVKSKCKVCGSSVTKLAQHIKRRHPEEAHKGVDFFIGEKEKQERKPYTRVKPYNWEKEPEANYEEDRNEGGAYVCRFGEECKKTFNSKKVYLKHIFLTHEGGVDSKKKKICDICGNLITANNMKQHVRTVHTHRNEKNFACEHCGKEFKYKSELNIHLTHHTGEMNFACSGCAKRFRRAAEARMCEKGHRGIFSFKCHMCEYKTNKKNHLDRHIESHLKATPFICPICGFKSGRKDNLKQHIEKRHCNSNTSIKQLEDMYTDMYKIHETCEAATIAKTEALAENFARLHESEDDVDQPKGRDGGEGQLEGGQHDEHPLKLEREDKGSDSARGILVGGVKWENKYLPSSVQYSEHNKYLQNDTGLIAGTTESPILQQTHVSEGLKYCIAEQQSGNVQEHEEHKYISADQQQEHNTAKIDTTAAYIYRQNLPEHDQRRESTFLEQQRDRERMIGIADQRRRDHRQRLILEQREERERLEAIQQQLQEHRQRLNIQQQQQHDVAEGGGGSNEQGSNNTTALAEMYHRIRSLE